MFAKSTIRLFLLATLAALALGLGIIGCDSDDDSTGAVGLTSSEDIMYASVYGWIQSGNGGGLYKATTAGDPVMAIIHVGNVPSVPVVTVNNATLAIEPELTMYGGGVGYYGMANTDENDSLLVTASFTNIDGDAATAYARVCMVDSFQITLADDDIQLALGDSLHVTWSAASGADEYWYRGYFECDYTDTAGEYRYYEWNFSCTSTDTAITIAADSIFGDISDVDSLRNLYGDFDLYAVSGCSLAGGPGNVSGSGMGMVLGMAYGGDLDISEVQGVVKASEPVGRPDNQPDFAELFRHRIIESR